MMISMPIWRLIQKRNQLDYLRIKLSGRMISIDDNSTVWEREELYQDENCYRLEDLKTQPELLVDILTEAIQNLAQNTVNEIL